MNIDTLPQGKTVAEMADHLLAELEMSDPDILRLTHALEFLKNVKPIITEQDCIERMLMLANQELMWSRHPTCNPAETVVRAVFGLTFECAVT